MNKDEIGARFIGIGNRWLQDAFVAKPSDVPPIIYHYTDAAGLEGMLRHGKVWLTDFRFLNDKTEMSYGIGQGKDFIRENLVNSKDKVRQRLCKEILEYAEIASPYEIYVFSSSDKKDDLSQWRGYACEGRGFTVGICGATVGKLTEGSDAPFGFGRVIYDSSKQNQVLSSSFKEVEDELRSVLKTEPDDVDFVFDLAAATFDKVIEGRAAASKHGSFAAETEWRIASFITRDDPDDDIKVRVSGGRLVPYVELYLDIDSKMLPVKEVGIGPAFVGSEATHAVETLLRVTGHHDAQIYFANAPYRGF
jgi:hypothetical protein